jgi:hypothetical protein
MSITPQEEGDLLSIVPADPFLDEQFPDRKVRVWLVEKK